MSLEVSVAPGMPLRRSPEVFGGALMQQKTKKSLTRARELGSAIFFENCQKFPGIPENCQKFPGIPQKS